MKKSNLKLFVTKIILILFVSSSIIACKTASTSKVAENEGFVEIFNGKNFDGWYLKIKSGDTELAKKVYEIEDGMVHVFKGIKDSLNYATGENATHGLFYTNKSYSKYILRFEYKWGGKITNNFNQWQYDAGVYYHVTNDKIWPSGFEYQIRYNHKTDKNHTGDLILAESSYDWYGTTDAKKATYLSKDEGGILSTKGWMHMAKPTINYNALNDKWNQCEIIVMGDEYAIHKLNGDIVNMCTNLSHGEGNFGFQSETAEIYYRNIMIKEFDKIIPAKEFLLNQKK